MPYLDMTDVNYDNDIRHSKISYSNQDTIQQYEALYCEKFRIQTKTFPAYIPNIAQPTSKLRIKLPSPYIDNTNETVWPGYFFSDYAISILNLDNNYYSTQPIKWIPQKNLELKPGSFPSRYQVLTNPYFYCYNSIHLLKMIEDTISQCLGDVGINNVSQYVRFIKTDNTFQLLIENTAPNIKIFLNYELSQAFNFYTTTTFAGTSQGFEEVVFNSDTITEIGNKQYYVAQVLSLTTKIFPFSDIQFSSVNLNVEKIAIITNQQPSSQLTVPIIFSFSLNVQDIDGPTDNFNYTASSEMRRTEILAGVQNFDIYAYFKTFDGFLIPVTLNKNDSINMLLRLV